MAKQRVIFLACAGELPGVKQECWGLKDLFKALKSKGHCDEVVVEEMASLERIVTVFEEYRDRIAIFHFAGHADPGRLMMESAFDARPSAQGKPAYAEGLASLLGQQRGLKLVFLNGCSTRAQVQRLLLAGVPAVIATARPIADAVARDFALAFYRALTTGGDGIEGGRNLIAAFRAAQGLAIAEHSGESRFLFAAPAAADDIVDSNIRPWAIEFGPGKELVGRWNLFDDDPLFGLPGLPDSIGLPDEPFRNLDWFGEEHARIFFGRARAIRELYDLITRPPAPGDASVILHYGQTGVGKTSLLAAGLMPRLKANYQLRYMRRVAALGLLGTLKAALAPGPEGFDLGQSWSDVEKSGPDRPLILILDQAEEAYTRSLSPAVMNGATGDATASEVGSGEIAALLDVIRSAFSPDRTVRPRGKLILSFRKEWLDEFAKACQAFQLAYELMPLSALDRDEVIEAVEGIVREPDLAAKWARYRLRITPTAPSEPTLAEFMADDLIGKLGSPSTGEASPIAPTLQLLLTRMWEVAKARGDGERVFDLVLYEEMKAKGFKLYEVITHQFSEIEYLVGNDVRNWLGEAARNGLLLDLLEAFTTPLDTAATRTKPDLHARYHLQPAVLIDALLEECTSRYLVAGVRSFDGGAAYRLAHDILAPVIRSMFHNSVSPAQRARRLLESRTHERTGAPDGVILDRADLQTVEEGLCWMRRLDVDEARLLEASRHAEACRVAAEEERQRRQRAVEEQAIAHLQGKRSVVLKFFQRAGCEINRSARDVLTISGARYPLVNYTPVRVRLCLDEAPERFVVSGLAQEATRDRQNAVAFLVYSNPPKATARAEFSAAWSESRVSIVPLELHAIENRLAFGDDQCWGLLDEALKNYGPGADLFSSTGQISDSLAFFGRQGLLTQIRNDLLRGQPVGLFGLRKAGKTSVLNHLVASLDDFLVIKLDLEGRDPVSYGTRIFNDILSYLGRLLKARGLDLGGATPIEESLPAAVTAPMFRERIRATVARLGSGIALPLMVFLDEVERILPRPEDRLEQVHEFNAVFGVLRALNQEERCLSLLIADLHAESNRINYWTQRENPTKPVGAFIKDIFKDYRTRRRVPTNPVFSFFKEVYLGPFELVETRDMLNGIGQLMGYQFDDPLIEAIHSEGGGYPVLSRQIASSLTRELSGSSQLTLDDRSRRVLGELFNLSRFFGTYCEQSIWEDMRDKGPRAASGILRILACANRPVPMALLCERLARTLVEAEIQQGIASLRDYGLIREDRTAQHEGFCIVPKLFARWLPATMTRRQRRQWTV